MAHYRCLFPSADGKITAAAENVEAASDAEALALSRELVRRAPQLQRVRALAMQAPRL
jgi:hypothetical protein